MTQHELAFPPPMTPAELAAAAVLERMVEERRASFEIQSYRRNRAAQIRRRGRA